ncbi:MAG: hypothetical protein ABFC88_02990 [Thermoguttaceae bacterium]
MRGITKCANREIVKDFAKEILQRRMRTAKPSKTVINFRTDIRDGIEREVFRVPIEILRFRKDNGRIASDVMDYERNISILDEKDSQAQSQIAEFLEQKDPEKTAALGMSIMHDGQRDPAIVTCDGFIINGNRRKMVMDRLRREHPDNEHFSYMKVVILPGDEEGEGGPPTLLEIEKIENRYQLQSDGKSEYYGFDRALSIKRKIDLGLPLQEQLRDDPRYVKVTQTELEKAVKQYEKDFLLPLACVDRYLRQFRREGYYRTISAGMSDPEGRWQAFKDYSDRYSSCFNNKKRLLELGIEEEEIGGIEEAAFDIIRLRTIPDMPKVHQIMRDLPKYCRTKEGKKEILKIADEVDPVLPREELFDNNGNPLSIDQIDAKWTATYKPKITWHVKKAATTHIMQKEKETPIGLLDAALKKLTHDDMDLKAIGISDFQTARKLIEDIKDRAIELEKQLYHHEKELKKLLKDKK